MTKKTQILGFILLMASFIDFSFASGIDTLQSTISKQTGTIMNIIYFILKIAGFALIIWGVADLIGEKQGQGSEGGKYVQAGLKIFVAALMLAGKEIGVAVGL